MIRSRFTRTGQRVVSLPSVDDWKAVERNFFYDYHRLSSPLFDEYQNIAQRNWEMQIKHLTGNQYFLFFCNYALHVYSMSPRYDTHFIFIQIEVGFNLAEIKWLESFRVCADTESANNMASFRVKDAQPADPYAACLLVAFKYQSSCNTFRLSTIKTSFPPTFGKQILPTEICDKRAAKYFALLQSIKYPAVTSPPLN